MNKIEILEAHKKQLSLEYKSKWQDNYWYEFNYHKDNLGELLTYNYQFRIKSIINK